MNYDYMHRKFYAFALENLVLFKLAYFCHPPKKAKISIVPKLPDIWYIKKFAFICICSKIKNLLLQKPLATYIIYTDNLLSNPQSSVPPLTHNNSGSSKPHRMGSAE